MADQPATPQQEKHSAPDGAGTPPEPQDELVVTRHTVRTADGRELRYTATSGRMVLRQEEHTDEEKFDGHKPKAEVFLTSYTLDDAPPRSRPVTFAFNG